MLLHMDLMISLFRGSSILAMSFYIELSHLLKLLRITQALTKSTLCVIQWV